MTGLVIPPLDELCDCQIAGGATSVPWVAGESNPDRSVKSRLLWAIELATRVQFFV